MFEQSWVDPTSWGKVANLFAKGIGGACFSQYGGTNIEWDNVGCKENHCEGIGGRDAGSGLMYYAGYENPSDISDCCYSTNIEVVGSKWYNSCRTPQLWQSKKNPNAF